MKNSKIFIYPLLILTIFMLIIFAIFSGLRGLGERVNPAGRAKIDKIETKSVFGMTVTYRDNQWIGAFNGEFEDFESEAKNSEVFMPLKDLSYAKHRASSEDKIFIMIKHSADKEKLRGFLKDLESFRYQKIYIASPYNDTLVNLKKLEPKLLFSISPKSWVKWSVYNSFFIEMLFSVDADYLYVSKKTKELLNERLQKEIERRGFFILSQTKVR